MRFKTLMAATMTVALVVPTLAACTKTKTKTDDTQRVLRIASVNMYGPDDGNFRQQFTQVFEYANPNIKVEMVPIQDPYQYMYRQPDQTTPQIPKDPLVMLKDVMNQPNPPDVVLINYDQLTDLVQNNMLAPLDPQIAKDKLDLSDVVPAVMDGLKKAGDNKLFALAPTFSSSALIYNKRMFDEAGVPYPKDNMTWDEMFDLARRVSKGDGDTRKYGFSFNSQAQDLYYAAQTFTMPLELSIVDAKGEKMTVDSDKWEKAWKTLIQLQNDKTMPTPPDYSRPMARDMSKDGPFSYDDFYSGRVAMTIIYYGQLSQLISANKNAENIKGFTKIDWDVATIPSFQENPGVVPNVGVSNVMAINAKAGNSEDAWKFIKFLNSEDWAKLNSSQSYQLVARKKYIKPKDGANYHVEAFYNVKPSLYVNELNKLGREKQNIYSVQEIGRQEMQTAITGQKSVREALKSWQTKGDALLQKIKENPTGPIDMSQFLGQGQSQGMMFSK